MQITRVVCPTSKYSIKCPDATTMQGITVHNTANDASAMSEISYMLGRPDKVSFHAAVDDYRIVEGLPFDLTDEENKKMFFEEILNYYEKNSTIKNVVSMERLEDTLGNALKILEKLEEKK